MTFWVAAVVIFLDRITKIGAQADLSGIETTPIIPGIFHLTLVLNKGAAFGLFKGQRVFFIVISCVVISLIMLYVLRRKAKAGGRSFALGLILGGAIGNLVDRVSFGYVIDFLDLRVWPVFNIADSCLTIGAAILIASIVRQKVSHASYPH